MENAIVSEGTMEIEFTVKIEYDGDNQNQLNDSIRESIMDSIYAWGREIKKHEITQRMIPRSK